jgi:ankyrin repeat protein
LKGYTALMMAAFHGDLDNVKALLAAGADLNAKNNLDDTALSLAKKEDVAAVLRGKEIVR